jgi:GYF domain 2
MTRWYYSLEGHATGPVSEPELSALASQGVVDSDTLIWQPEMELWEPVSKLKPEILAKPNEGVMAPQTKDATDRRPASEKPAPQRKAAKFVKQVPLAPGAKEEEPEPSFFSRLFGRKKK